MLPLIAVVGRCLETAKETVRLTTCRAHPTPLLEEETRGSEGRWVCYWGVGRGCKVIGKEP